MLYQKELKNKAYPISPVMRWHRLGLQDYTVIWEAMRQFATNRSAATIDELWTLEHFPIYTLGQAGDVAHIINPNNIPVIRSDRGGQVTYHGPGQIIAYIMYDMRRGGIGIKTLVWRLEQALINLLAEYNVTANRRANAPGVYVEQYKIASLGLRVRNSCSFHGLSLNCNMDLEPFSSINPCGDASLVMTQMANLLIPTELLAIQQVEYKLAQHITLQLQCLLASAFTQRGTYS